MSSVCNACCRLSVVALEGYKMELNELDNTVAIETVMGSNDRLKAIKWLSKQNILVMQEVFKLKKNHFFKIKAEGAIHDPLLIELIAFYIAIKEIVAQTHIPNRKSQSGNFGFLRKIGDTRSKQLRKSRKNLKLEKLLNLQGIVKTLIEEKQYSYRQVSEYLKTYHRFSVSHTKIGQFYQTIKKGQ